VSAAEARAGAQGPAHRGHDSSAEEGREASLERQSFVRHELRGPLAVMYPLLSLLLDEGAGPLTPAQRGYLEMLERNVKRLHALVGSATESGWLDRAGAAPEPAAVPLAGVAEGVIGRLQGADRSAVPIKVVSERGPAVAWADPEHVRCLVRNLVDNALRYGGTDVEVHVGRSDDGRAVLRVEDHGRGMGEAEAAAAFDFGVRGSAAAESGEPGMGIGLWVCRQLAEANGGSVDLETAEGAGTAVTVTLPAAGG
jgi:two-component system sensor kinase FixL